MRGHMGRRSKKVRGEKDLTERFLSGNYDEDRAESVERFSARSKGAQQSKMLRTALMRAEQEAIEDLDALPVGEVRQVFSLYSEVEHAGETVLCVVRKTLSKLMETAIVVGDEVKFARSRPLKRRRPSSAASRRA